MFKFVPRMIPNQIFIVGCGGTGSRLVPLITQFMSTVTKENNPKGWISGTKIFLIDDDVVEEKNLLRQNFVRPDVGKHKATVLAQRYGKAYNMNVIPITKRVDGNPGDLFRDIPGDPSMARSMVIMCVDSAKARRAILNTVDSYPMPEDSSQATFIIDSGNEDTFGQVKFFNWTVFTDTYNEVYGIKAPKLSPISYEINSLPVDFNFYRDLVDTAARGSCADLDQTLAINNFMSADIVGIVQAYFYNQGFTFNTLSKSLDGANETLFNTLQNFLRLTLPYDNEVSVNGGNHRYWQCKAKGSLKASNLYRISGSGIFQDYINRVAKELKKMEAPKPAEVAANTDAIAKRPSKKKTMAEVMKDNALKDLIDAENRIRETVIFTESHVPMIADAAPAITPQQVSDPL